MNSLLRKLVDLGYTVEPAREGGNTYRVVGPATATYVESNDAAALKALADPAAHEERVFQADHPEAAAAIVDLRNAGFDVRRDGDTVTVNSDGAPERQSDVAALPTIAAELTDTPTR